MALHFPNDQKLSHSLRSLDPCHPERDQIMLCQKDITLSLTLQKLGSTFIMLKFILHYYTEKFLSYQKELRRGHAKGI